MKKPDYKKIVETRRKNSLEKNGVDCIQKTKEYKEKMRQLKKNISEEEKRKINEKREQTTLRRYKVKYITQVPEIKEKMRNSYFEKTGFHHNSENPEVIAKRKAASIEKYGTDCPLNSPDIQKEIRRKRKEETGYEHHMQDPKFRKKNRQHLLELTGYEHNWADPEVRKKMYAKYKERTGYDCPMVDPNVISKMHRKYSYDNKTFDSKPEIAYYIWLKDNQFTFEYHPKISFEYFDKNGNKHYYFPDFIVENEYIELKGCHFFSSNGKMRFPYKDSKWSKEQCDEMDDFYERKHQCILKNHVKILTDFEYYITYVNEKYGKDFLSLLKTNKILNKMSSNKEEHLLEDQEPKNGLSS